VQILGGSGDMMTISVSVEKGIEKIKNVEGFGKVKFHAVKLILQTHR